MHNIQSHRSSKNTYCTNCRALENEISELKKNLAEMQQHAYHDALTGLSNRRYFVESLEKRIARCQRYGDNCAVLFLDVDNLKTVNDRHGHAAGDALLMRLAAILKSHTRTTDVIARIGGDEFGLLLDNLDDEQVQAKIAFLVKQFGQANCSHNGIILPLGASIGHCLVGPKDTIESLMSRADAEMYRIKEGPE